MPPSAGSARNRSISSARPPEARRALPCTAGSVVENTTFGSGFQIAATRALSRRAMDPGRRLPVQHRLVQLSSQQVDADLSYLVGDEAEDLLVGRRPVEGAVRPGDVAVK
jgi:hypothetical protein